VIAREDDGPGGKRLVGYVVAAEDRVPYAAVLRAHLGQSLPEHMVPSAFVVLERLPLTPNGKLDRSARNEPEIADSQLPEEALTVFAESDVIHKSVPVKEPRA
jgi:acyl-CoA synthetase (AMP-forming)/AMP-acid ligase II